MVSLGPADPELITLKALRALQNAHAICVPTKSPELHFETSITHGILQALFKEFGFEKPLIPLFSPMKFQHKDWEAQVKILNDAIKTYGTICYVTLGDAGVYSTVYYLLDILKKEHPSLYEHCVVIPGVTSFSQASAKIKKPLCLGNSRFELVPLLDKDVSSTKVYMRPKTGTCTKAIEAQGELFTFENLNLPSEQIFKGKKECIEHYMTLLIDFNTHEHSS